MYKFTKKIKKQFYTIKDVLQNMSKNDIIMFMLQKNKRHVEGKSIQPKTIEKEVNVYFIKMGEILHKRSCKSPKNNNDWSTHNPRSCADKI